MSSLWLTDRTQDHTLHSVIMSPWTLRDRWFLRLLWILTDLAVLRSSARALQRMSFDLGLSALLFSQVYTGVMLFEKRP